jgi:hypothetical protein
MKAAIVVEAGQGGPGFETAPGGAQRDLELLHELGQGEDFASPPALEQRGGGIADTLHGEEEIWVVGTVYESCLKHTYSMPNRRKRGKGKSNDLRGNQEAQLTPAGLPGDIYWATSPWRSP